MHLTSVICFFSSQLGGILFAVCAAMNGLSLERIFTKWEVELSQGMLSEVHVFRVE